MNTIEMLKELVENGGMFEVEVPIGYVVIDYVTITDNGVEWLYKHDDTSRRVFAMGNDVINMKWKPYVKPVDWSKVPIDTKVLCDCGNGWFVNRYFAGVSSITGKPETWAKGATSWSAQATREGWKEIKLAEDAPCSR